MVKCECGKTYSNFIIWNINCNLCKYSKYIHDDSEYYPDSYSRVRIDDKLNILIFFRGHADKFFFIQKVIGVTFRTQKEIFLDKNLSMDETINYCIKYIDNMIFE